MLRELSVTEQRHQAVLVVIEDGVSVTEAAVKAGGQRSLGANLGASRTDNLPGVRTRMNNGRKWV